MILYQSQNVLISYKLNAQTSMQVKELDCQLRNHHLERPMPNKVIDQIFQTHVYARNIIIGVSQDSIMISSAERFKTQLEDYLHKQGAYPFIVKIVTWNDHSKNMKKFERAFVEHEPDLWFVFSNALGFSRLLKRLYRNEYFDASRTYCLSNLCSNSLLHTLGEKYFEGMKGVTPSGRSWHVNQGEIQILTS
ncbi:hypothetical protein BUZ56_05735 [Staphylococcus hyicus]|uniref:hypothetical protein n=1 Tax=Staphylococcus hyicus TaxID=1284 RepID=UPI000D1D8339|nr:hypothetical protein [Staphylococcus hyicus]MDP4449415.1 hypothetical protein [Staphylococcus hyicus]MDP4469522.1 hypothetical protein [Staphylococcus hyicus]MDY3698129.1 hypothetical protein [Staphylococcus hyicus]NJI31550.1 hypothetical protein [Staphylococcus hyicus]PTJ71018.1 hypothetical protein BUZ58_08700 [Staphylococcus hyicus]